MDNNKKMELLDRNKKIIQIIITEMERSCPDSIDLIGIGGSFCNGDYYEKSDLDLLIIRNNDDAKILEKTFILNDIGFDVYTQEWKDLEELSKYDTPYVTKLFELGIVYFKNQEVINKIKSIQRNLKLNMLNEKITKERAGNHFRNALEAFDHLEATENKTEAYLAFSRIIKEIESVVYFLNREFTRQSIKNVPHEIKNMKVLPEGFKEAYKNIEKCNNKEEMIRKASKIIGIMQLYLDSLMIECEYKYEEKTPIEKKNITKDELVGTYEELYSNYRNKMYHAIDIKNSYLSFMAMSGAQEFYKEFTDKYNIPEVNLLEQYNPNDLEHNKDALEESLRNWKKLCDEYGVTIENYNGLSEVERLYKKGKPVIKLS